MPDVNSKQPTCCGDLESPWFERVRKEQGLARVLETCKVMENNRYGAGCTKSNNGVLSTSPLLNDVTRQEIVTNHFRINPTTSLCCHCSSCRLMSLGKNFFLFLLHCILKLCAACTIPVLCDYGDLKCGIIDITAIKF